MKSLVLLCVFIGYCAAQCGNSSGSPPPPPWATTRPPWVTARPPWATTRPPWVTARPPWATTRPPWVTARPPWATTRPPSRPENGSCNFDDRPCSRFMRQDMNDDFDWTVHAGSTPSHETGPSGDHTSSYGKYIYAETSYPRSQGDRARLTARVRTQYPACFYFYYHMYGQDMGSLKIYLNQRLVWEMSGNQGDQWIRGTFPIRHAGYNRLDFDAIVGPSYQSDIALDDLGYMESYYSSSCMVTPSCAHPGTLPTMSPTYPPYTTYYPRPSNTYPPYTTSYPQPNNTHPPINNVSCGLPSVPMARVIGGIDANPGSWPWQVGLYYYGTFICGGSLISPEWVVTAAHCIFTNVYDIVLGDHMRNATEGYEQRISSSKIIVHPNWNSSTIDFDIALIKLSRPAILNSHVQPVCLPRRNEYLAPGTRCYITGWGKIKHPGSAHNTLQQAVLPVVSQWECQRKLANSSHSGGLRITNNMVCGGTSGSLKSGCHGDSGGPYVCQDRWTHQWKLQGVVSWGSPRCDASQRYTVFARVSRMKYWIDFQTRYNK